jgi:signal transduction histidine kinase
VLVEAHGGMLTLDSAVGKGTRVTVVFPATRLRMPVNLAATGT